MRSHPAPPTPAQLVPYAWYDAHLGGSATQIADSSANARAAATFGAGSNSPLWLQYTGSPYAYNPSLSGITYSVNATAFASGDRTIRIKILPASWSDANDFLAGYATAGQIFTLRKISNTTLRCYWQTSVPATTSKDVTGPSLSALAAGGPLWLEAALDVDDGAGNHVVAVRTSSDGVTWAAWASTTTAGVTTCVPTSTLSVSIGGDVGYSYTGAVYAGSMLAGFQGGTVEASFDAALCGQTGYTDAVGSLAGTWTVTRATSGRKMVVLSPAANSARSVILFGTDDYGILPVAATPPMNVNDTWSIVAVARVHQASLAGMRTMSSWTKGFLMADAFYCSDGTNSGVITLPGYTVSTVSVFTATVNGTGATAVGGFKNNTAATAATNALVGDRTPITAIYLGRDPGGGSYGDFEALAFFTFNRVLTASEQAHLVAYYGGGA